MHSGVHIVKVSVHNRIQCRVGGGDKVVVMVVVVMMVMGIRFWWKGRGG